MSTDPWLFVALFTLSLSTVAVLWWKIGRSEHGKGLRDELERGKEAQRNAFRDEWERLARHLNENSKTQREELRGNREELSKTLREKFEDVEKKVRELTLTTERHSVNARESLDKIRESNEKRLEKIRETVEEKLQETLNKRLNESFKRVQDSLDKVTQNVDKMNDLAKDVGGLQKVLSNVKTKGMLGEVQLGSILEDILPGRYEKEHNVGDGRERVDYAVKLPGHDSESHVYLPIDSKFPQELYVQLQEAYEKGEKEEIEAARNDLCRRVKVEAKSICEKYINPPETTNFAVMFVPTEGLYAEITRDFKLTEEIRQKHHVLPAGPTILSALLNSFREGFRTLQIQKNSAETFRVLVTVKEQFGKFAGALTKVEQKMQAAQNELANVKGTRTNVMYRELHKVDGLSESLAAKKNPASPELPLSPPEEE